MEKKLYFTKIQGRQGIYDTIVAARNENNARAIVEEYFGNDAMEVRPCTMDDVNKIDDKRIMHMSHMMTPISEGWLQTII